MPAVIHDGKFRLRRADQQVRGITDGRACAERLEFRDHGVGDQCSLGNGAKLGVGGLT